MKRIMKYLAFIAIIVMVNYNLSSQDLSNAVKNLVNQKMYEEASAIIPDALKEKIKDASIYELFGDVYFEIDKYDSALIMYQKAYDIDDDIVSIMQKYGRTLSKLGRHKEAIEFLLKAKKRTKDNPSIYLELGMAYLHADSITLATYTITQAREKNKSNPEAYLALGDLYYKQGVLQLAKDNYADALKLNENLNDARMKLAIVYFEMAYKEQDKELSDELFKRSLIEWNILTQKDSMNAKAFFEQGKINFMAKRYDYAAKSFNRFVKLRPSGIIGRWYLAQSYKFLGLCDSAAPHLNIIVRDIDSAQIKKEALFMLAECYYYLKKYNECIKTYDSIKTIDTLSPTEMRRYATAYLYIGDTAQAINKFEEYFNKDSSDCKQIVNFAILLQKINQPRKAIRYFTMFYQNCSSDSSIFDKVFFNLGRNYFNVNSFDTAVHYFKKAILIDSNNVWASIYLGDAYANLNQTDLAISSFLYAFKIGSSDTTNSSNVKAASTAAFKICGIYIKNKNFKDLLKIAQNWTTVEPKNEVPWLYIAISYHNLEDLDNACKAYKKVLQINPSNKDAKKYMQSIPNCQ